MCLDTCMQPVGDTIQIKLNFGLRRGENPSTLHKKKFSEQSRECKNTG